MTIKPSLVLLFALTFILSAHAEVYIWFDADGNSHFVESESDNPPSVENRNGLNVKASTDNKNQAAPQVDLYVTSWCPYCKKAIAFMYKNNITFNEYDIEQNTDALERKEKLAPDYSGVPLAVINGIAIRGFSEAKYQKALAKKSN